MEYLEEKFPAVPLLPKDLAKRAKVSGKLQLKKRRKMRTVDVRC